MTDSVKVRIAVAVDPNGKWYAVGWKGADDGAAWDYAVDGVGDGAVIHWVTAELPVPAPVEIEGQVEHG